MKIAYICTDSGIPIFGNKGASIHIREIVSGFQRLKNEVFVVVTCRGGEVYPGFDCTVYEVEPFSSKKLGSDLRKILTNIKLLLFSLRIFSKEKPDVIYERYASYGFAGGLLAKVLSLPHLIEVNAPLLISSRRIKFYGLARLIEGVIFRLADGVILTTSYLEGYIRRMGAKDASIYVVPDGVDTEKFKLTKKDTKILKNLTLEGSFIVGFIGALMPRHGLETLIEAAKSLKGKSTLPLKYLIIGEGRREEKLKKKVESSNLTQDFLFLKNIKHEDIPAYINLMDICVLPDMSIYSSPVKIFEYMAMAKPVILPSKGQPQQIFRHLENCLFIEPRNQKQLVEAILLLERDENLREKLGRNAREKISREFTWLRSAEKILKIYGNLQKRGNLIPEVTI